VNCSVRKPCAENFLLKREKNKSSESRSMSSPVYGASSLSPRWYGLFLHKRQLISHKTDGVAVAHAAALTIGISCK